MSSATFGDPARFAITARIDALRSAASGPLGSVQLHVAGEVLGDGTTTMLGVVAEGLGRTLEAREDAVLAAMDPDKLVITVDRGVYGTGAGQSDVDVDLGYLVHRPLLVAPGIGETFDGAWLAAIRDADRRRLVWMSAGREARALDLAEREWAEPIRAFRAFVAAAQAPADA